MNSLDEMTRDSYKQYGQLYQYDERNFLLGDGFGAVRQLAGRCFHSGLQDSDDRHPSDPDHPSLTQVNAFSLSLSSKIPGRILNPYFSMRSYLISFWLKESSFDDKEVRLAETSFQVARLSRHQCSQWSIYIDLIVLASGYSHL